MRGDDADPDAPSATGDLRKTRRRKRWVRPRKGAVEDGEGPGASDCLPNRNAGSPPRWPLASW